MVHKNKKAVLIGLLLALSAFILPATFMVRGQQETLFSMTLTTPSTNPSRQEWSEVIQNNLQAVGIDANRVIQDWGTIYDRALDPPADIRQKTFDEGGYDALFVGYALGTDPDPYAVWHSSQMPPGQNYYNFDNSRNDELCTLIKETVDETARLGYVAEWQTLMAEEVPSLALMYTEEVVAFDPTALEGQPFIDLHYPLWPEPHYWDLASGTEQTTIVLAQTGPAPEEGLNPWVTTSYYDLTVFGSVFNRLMRHEHLVPPIPMEPELATSWSVADDDKTWTVNLRQGVKWHDGTEFTAADVKFTYTAAMAEELASQTGAFVEAIIGSPDNIEIVNDYQLIFRLPEPYSYFISGLLGAGTTGWMLPKHVLEDVPYDEWRTHPFNTGEGSYMVGDYEAWGPIGTGPYWYMAYDPITFTNFMGKNADYWDKDTLEAAGVFEIEEYRVVFIEGSDAAITALRQGDVDVLDSQYHLETKVDSLEDPWGDWVRYEAFGVQELGINMAHPILGTGVDTPLGQSDPSRAAEAAKYVRQAISHLIPRQNIIDTILDGFGTPAITNTICTLTAGYDPNLPARAYDVELAKSLLAAAGYDTGVPPPAGDFLSQYGLYLAIAVVVVVIAIGAVFYLRRR